MKILADGADRLLHWRHCSTVRKAEYQRTGHAVLVLVDDKQVLGRFSAIRACRSDSRLHGLNLQLGRMVGAGTYMIQS